MPDAPTENPWGDDFDAAKAWNLVQNLRGEVSTLKSEKSTLAAEKSSLETDLTAAQAEAQTAKDALAQAERSSTVAAVISEYDLDPDEVGEFLSGDLDEATLRARAERLAKLAGKTKKEAEKEPQEGAEKDPEGLPEKPKPGLKPGQGGEDADPGFDPAAVAALARANRR